MAQNVILEVRLPRILGALLVGASLAVAGAAYQGIFRNPLVSPDLLGVSSGACIGAAAAILAGWGAFGVQGAAFAGGLGAVACTVTIPKLLKRDSTITLVLSGIIVGGFCGSILGLVKYLADPETQLPEIVYWQMGSLAKVDYGALASIAPVMVVSMTAVLVMRWRINVLSLGDHEAKALGVNLKVERGVVIFFATLLTASAVSLAGTIGWVGLVIPHLARFVVGPNASRSIPVACLMAAGFMLVVDTLARVSGIETVSYTHLVCIRDRPRPTPMRSARSTAGAATLARPSWAGRWLPSVPASFLASWPMPRPHNKSGGRLRIRRRVPGGA